MGDISAASKQILEELKVNIIALLSSSPPPPNPTNHALFQNLYINKILPVEEATSYNSFGHSPLNAGEFDSPPLVLLVGPYSAGKTTFIEHIIGKTFPGQRVGPEPTTDKFCAVLHGKEERVIPGNALTVAPGTPFKGLQMFGNNFLTRFEGSQVDADILRNMTLIDSPGVLSGDKQTLGRSYSYNEVLNWFAERSDMIILLFDVSKVSLIQSPLALRKTRILAMNQHPRNCHPFWLHQHPLLN